VITQTADQVHDVCEFIEKVFDIDRRNSEDVSCRLRPTEFGYRSVHYIVMLNPDKLEAAGINVSVPSELLRPEPLKAEIQVRTLLEHAWADIGHDMTYKTELKVPARIHRQCAALAASLERGDQEFGRLVHEFDAFKSNFGACHEPQAVNDEIDRLRIVLASDPGNAGLAVRIAQLALAIGEHDLALEVLEPYAARNHQGVQRVRGVALTEKHWDEPRSAGYREGRKCLSAACAHSAKDAETLCALAENWAREDDSQARRLYHDAAAVDATEPVTLCRYLEFEIAHIGNDRWCALPSR